MNVLNGQIIKLLNKIEVHGKIELTVPPNPEMGDLSFACFDIAKRKNKNPAEVAKEIKKELDSRRSLPRTVIRGGNDKIERIEAVGPYVNFYLDGAELARLVLGNKKEKKKKKKEKIMVEFAHPNTHKAFHIGHVRNIITGESLARILENAGYKVIRTNYQGDIGLHIAKCLWGVLQIRNPKSEIRNFKTLEEKIKFLGEAYARGGQAYEKDEQAKQEIIALNEKIYYQDKTIKKLYQTTRKWSLEYFDKIYKRLGTKFDRLYFESEVFKRGRELVAEFIKKEIFKQSQGAVIFEGSKYGLHDRVFLNSKGFPTYEAKDLALAELQFKEYDPDKIYHVVAKEQSEYFKVLFKALEFTLPKSKGKEAHLVYGWVQLKEGKMSSRTGQVVLGEWLLDEVEKKIAEIMRDREIKDKEKIIRKIANAAVKYSMLKTGIQNDIAFDINESVSLEGDSGPYLLYIVARINSILKKTKKQKNKKTKIFNIKYSIFEKQLLLKLAEFEEVAERAAEEKNPSIIAKYLFSLAQAFNSFYQNCPVLQAEGETRIFRLQIIKSVVQAMKKGLYLLGIETVEEM